MSASAWDVRAPLFKYEYTDSSDIEFLCAYVDSTMAVLEVPCAAGRLTPYLAKRARHVISCDREPNMVSELQKTLNELNIDNVTTQVACMSTVRAEGLDLIIVPREAIQLLPGVDGVRRTLGNFRTMLNPGGRVIIDTYRFQKAGFCHRDHDLDYYDPHKIDGDRYLSRTHKIDSNRERARYNTQYTHDHTQYRVRFDYITTDSDNGVIESLSAVTTCQIYDKGQLDSIISEAGLSVEGVFQDYKGMAGDTSSGRLIYVLRKSMP